MSGARRPSREVGCRPPTTTASRTVPPDTTAPSLGTTTGKPARSDPIGRPDHEWGLQRGDQPLHALVARLERVRAEDGALRLVVELQVDPVDRVVALALLGPLDERAAQARPGRLRRHRHRLGDLLVV